jgi:hypothetical protein
VAYEAREPHADMVFAAPRAFTDVDEHVDVGCLFFEA